MRRAELAEMLESGPAILGSAADPALRPAAFRVWGARLDGDDLRALASVDVLRTIGEQPTESRMAFVITDITTFRSMQVKGTVLGPPAPPTAEDIDFLRWYHDRFTERLAEIGHPPLLADRLRPVSVVAVTIAIDAVFDQTPGPGAGVTVGDRLG